MGLAVITEPVTEPISLDEAKLHLRVDHCDEDYLIASLISAARRNVETFMRRPVISTKYRLTIDRFPGYGLPSFIQNELAAFVADWSDLIMRLPVGGVTAIDSIKYIDTSQVEQTLSSSNYILDASEQPARIAPAYNKAWPATLAQIAAVKIEFFAGYASPSVVPKDIIAALKLMLGHLYENREAVASQTMNEIPMGAEYLLWPHRVHGIWKG